MSFNYTPPPPEVIRTGQTLGYILYASLIFVPKVKFGAIIGGMGCFAISFWVSGHASGDMGSLSHFIDPPVDGIIGALIGGFISFISQSIWRVFNKDANLESIAPGADIPDASQSQPDESPT